MRKYSNLLEALEVVLKTETDVSLRIPEPQLIQRMIGLRKGEESKENFKRLLFLAVHWRAGPRLGAEAVYRILDDFDKRFEFVAESAQATPLTQDDVDEFYECGCSVDFTHEQGCAYYGFIIVAVEEG